MAYDGPEKAVRSVFYTRAMVSVEVQWRTAGEGVRMPDGYPDVWTLLQEDG